jgi:predicted metal-dependent hydrolase
MSRQWGSCSPSEYVILNPHLVKAPRDCVDYVVIHEPAHLKHHNHGPDFFKFLDQLQPRWEQYKRTLDNMVELAFSE